MDELAGSSNKKAEEKDEGPVGNFGEKKKHETPLLDDFSKQLMGMKKEADEDENGKKKKKKEPTDSDDDREQNAAS